MSEGSSDRRSIVNGTWEKSELQLRIIRSPTMMVCVDKLPCEGSTICEALMQQLITARDDMNIEKRIMATGIQK